MSRRNIRALGTLQRQSMLQNQYSSVLNVQTQDEFKDELVRFAKQMGFATISAIVVIDDALGHTEFIGVHNTPDGYLSTYHDLEQGKRDPVAQHCKAHSVPIVWDQSTYSRAGQGDRWERQAQYGYRCGISVAMHMPKGLHFCVGVDRDQPLPANLDEIKHMAAELHLFTAHAQDVAMRLLIPKASQGSTTPKLTPRELECLRWTMEGKTAWEVGRILSIAENTVVRHIYNATHKLDSVNKHHAVVRALNLGLIW